MGRIRKLKQLVIEYPQWGGKRKGAGRKLQQKRSSVPHRRRPRHIARCPEHVTFRLRPGLPTLRSKAAHEAVVSSLLACNERYGVRFIHYVTLSNHIHLICEADDGESLRRGMSALAVRLARALQWTWNLRGPVFGDRFHSRALSTPREVRNALAYLLLNAQHHGVHVPGGLDPYSSAAWFDGWADAQGKPLPPRSGSWLSVRTRDQRRGRWIVRGFHSSHDPGAPPSKLRKRSRPSD